MAEGEHVAPTESKPDQQEWGASRTLPGAGPETGISSHNTEDRGGSVPLREFYQHEHEGPPPESGWNSLYPTPVHSTHSNSKHLTAWHLHVLVQALELPTTGSTDQLQQCI